MTAQNAAGLSSAGTSFTAQSDAAAPTSTISCDSATCIAGWYTSSPVSIAVTATDAGAGVKRITYTTDGTDPTSSGTATTVAGASATFNITTLGNTDIRWIAEDNVGNISTVSSQTVKLDTSAPSAPTGFTFTSTSHAYWPGGSTVFFQGGGSGGFTVTAGGSSDSESGISGYTYPTLSSGWNNSGGDYTFDNTAATDSGSVTAQNNAGLTGAGTSFTAQSDSAAPTSTISCNTVACIAGWYTSSPVAVAISGNDAAGAGVERIVYTTNGTDPTINSSDTVTNGTPVAGNSASFNITTLGSNDIRWIVEDNVGNVSTVSSQTVQLDTTAPNAPTLSYSGFNHAYYPGGGSTVFFQGNGSGGFTVTASGSTDPQSGLAGYTYPTLSGWTNLGGDYSFDNTAGTQTGSVTAQNNAGLSSAGASFTAQSDSAAPTSSASCNTVACITGWYTSSPVAVALTGDDGAGAGVERIVYTTDGTDPTINGSDAVINGTEVTGGSASLNITSLGTNTVKWIAEDNVGNVSSVSSQTVKLDTTAPSAPAGFVFSATSHAYSPGGSTVYFQSGGTGGFTVTANGSTDPQSGVTGYSYPALSGGGWSNTGGDYTYDSSALTQSGSVTAQNAAGLSSAGTSFTAQSDAAAPTSTISCDSATCIAGWYTSSPVSIAVTATDAGAGVKRITYTTDGTDPTSSGTATTVAGASATFNITTLGNTDIRWIAEDNVGNISTVSSQTVKLDTSAPSAPTGFTFTSTSHAYWPGGSTVFFQGGGSGGFTVTAGGSSDSESGISGYTYPTLGTGWNNGGGVYTFDSGAATQTGSVTAQNNAGLTGAGTSFTAQSDAAAPTSSLTCNGFSCPGGWSNATPVNIDINASDGASGVASITYTTDGSDPTSSGTATTVNAVTASFQVSSAQTIKWFSTDRVGNASSVQSTSIQIDTTPPSAPTGFTFTAPSHAYWPGFGSTVFFQGGGTGGFTVTASGSTDSQSGVAGYSYPGLGTGWSNTGGDYSFTSAAGSQSGSVSAQDSAGNSGSGTSFTAQSDSTAPTSSVSCNSIGCSAGWYTSSPVSVAITGNDAAGAGVARIVYTTDGSDPTINGADTVTNGTEVTGPSASLNITSLGSTDVRWIAEDKVGNLSGVGSQVVQLDTTAPSAPTGFVFSATSHAYSPGGTTVYFQSGGTGGFTVTANGSTDPQSGVTGYTYPTLGSGWNNTGGDYTYDSSALTQSGSVTAQNAAGLSSAGTSFTAQSDAAAPTSTISCDSVACIAGWYTSSPVSIALSGNDGGAGVARIVYTSDGSDPTINTSSDAVTNGTAVAGNSAIFNITSLGNTDIRWIAEDNVGNISTVSSQTVKLDTTAPSAPTGFTFTSTSHAYWPGGSTVFFQAGGTGGFTVTAGGSSDSESGISGYTYPTLSGAAGTTAAAPTPSTTPQRPTAAPSPPKTTPASPAAAPTSPPRATPRRRPARSTATASPASPAGTPAAPSRSRSAATTAAAPASPGSSTPPTAPTRPSTVQTPSPTAPPSPATRPTSTSPASAAPTSAGSSRTTSATCRPSARRRSSSTPPPRTHPPSPTPASTTPTTPAAAPPSSSRATAAAASPSPPAARPTRSPASPATPTRH